jgi:hypothetical protein
MRAWVRQFRWTSRGCSGGRRTTNHLQPSPHLAFEEEILTEDFSMELDKAPGHGAGPQAEQLRLSLVLRSSAQGRS